MIDFFKNIFSNSPKADLGELISKGAMIIDVRSPGEYKGGHLKNSTNIPLDQLSGKIGKLDKNKPVITCCASGMRSASAKSILLSNGFKEVHNGGGWTNLLKYDK